MRKIVVSTKHLESVLSKIDFKENFCVTKVEFFMNRMRIFYQQYLGVDSIYGYTDLIHSQDIKDEILDQTDCRWDWLYDNIKLLSEQPCVLDIENKKLRLIFDF